jgi:hypothetical protein
MLCKTVKNALKDTLSHLQEPPSGKEVVEMVES